MKQSTVFLCLLLLVGQASASHLIGGYISAVNGRESALTFTITATIYYNTSAAATNEGTITLCFGDGSTQEAVRTAQRYSSDRSLSFSTYRITHTYGGPGTYTITTSLSNRTPARNITNPTQEPLVLSTTILTSSLGNRTPVLSIPSTNFQVALNQRLVFPLKATDEDGDSLLYSLTRPRTNTSSSACVHRLVDSYQYPNDLARRGTFKLNSLTGDLIWDSPTDQGYFSVAITVGEYRNGLLISQTNQEIALIVVDQPGGVPGIIPAYEPALEGGIVTALTNDRDEEVRLAVFPNPVEDRLQVVVQSSNPTTTRIQLLDSSGRLLHELAFNRLARRHEQVIGMGSLTPGLYLIRAETDGRTLVQKVTKK